MAEAKPFASLSSGLLARKGAARPAMRRPDPLSAARIDSLTHGNAAMHVPLDDLGWNDMGYDVNPDRPDASPWGVTGPKLTTIALQAMAAADDEAECEANPTWGDAAPVADAGIAVAGAEADFVNADDVAPAAPVPTVRLAVKSRSKPVVKVAAGAVGAPTVAGQRPPRAAFTLRLEPDRHLRLRLACAVRHVSAQYLVTQALDAYLATIPQVAALAQQADADDARQD